MKKVWSLLLAAVMLACALPVIAGAGALSAAAETLPAAVDLSGSEHLPPIGNQGGVGCCVSMAATYMQLTNAYSRYLHEMDASITWNPSSGNGKYCFAPRFTYNIGGASTDAVYHILQEQGAPFQTVTLQTGETYSMSYSGGVTGAASDNQLARNWGVADGIWESAQTYRISGYDHYWLSWERYGGENAFNITGTAAGQELINKIKASLNAGNVVVTGGYPDRWVTDVVTISNRGTYGKSGDYAIPYSTMCSSGGHQVSIIGYDDNITCVKNGVVLTGAFKIANSWGNWYNDGCIWLMYDALNGEGQSEFEALNVSDRIWTMDQIVLLDYKTDLKYGTPELMAKLTVSTADREDFTVTLKRYDPVTGAIDSYVPAMFAERSRGYDSGSGTYYNFNGARNSSAVAGVLTFNYDHFTDDLPEGRTVDDYLWGVEVTCRSTGSNKYATVKKVELLKNGESVCAQDGLNDTITADGAKTYILDDRNFINFDTPKGVTVTLANGCTAAATAGTKVSFTVALENGYKASNSLNVLFNGERVIPVDGVYTITTVAGDKLTANTVKIEGAAPNTVKTVDLGVYGSGFEYHTGYAKFWMLIMLDKSGVDPAAVDTAAIESGSYLYTLRVTVNGAVYDFVPDSYYDFGGTLLFRVPVADQGWFPASGTAYNVKVEFCLKGVPIYRDNSLSVTNNDTPQSSSMTQHTHSYTGEQFTVTTSNCTTAGTAFKRCSHPGCRAVQPVTLELDNTAHTFGVGRTVTKNATSSAPGEFSATCTLCGQIAFAGYFNAAMFDTNGDNRINIRDATLLFSYLSKEADYEDLACGGDFDGDGLCTIKDMTALLLRLSEIT